MGLSSGSAMTTSLMSQSRSRPYCMADKVDKGKILEFKLL